ncbi:MAG: hypothetical protein HYR56_04865 [Acidobacteria bacterium]|nr:hypothetical protein [Acidobacteriota bacterium]MBI3427598.1 hypothetical protein [Acidobacteriota bacterium]
MKRIDPSVFSVALAFSLTLCAQAQSNNLILSKDTGGPLTRTALGWTLRANPSCDQTGEAFPDGSRLISEDLTFATDANGLGTVQGTVQIFAPDGRILQVMTLRGIVGLNVRRDADKECRSAHIEAQLEPVPTFAAPTIPQIALATLSADLDPRVAGPLPTYRAKLDGVVTLPTVLVPGKGVTLNPDKNNYGEAEAITATIFNGAAQPITAFDLKSYCSIVRLQRQAGEDWRDIGECFLKRMSLPVTIGAGETLRVVLQPGENANPLKEPGAYRLLFEYFLGTAGAPATPSGEMLSTLSPAFRVTAMPTRQSVKLLLDAVPQFVGQVFVARILNDTDLPLQTADHKSQCTVFDVQRRDASGDWKNMATCLLASPTKLIRIAPHQSYEVKLGDDQSGLYPAGTYRLELNYQTINSDQTLGANTLLHTPEFTLRVRQ